MHIDTNGKADGRRIFLNHVEFYPDDLPSPIKDHTLKFEQLMYKSLKVNGIVDVKTAIMQSMVFEGEMLELLLQAKIPITVFLERAKTF